MVHLVHAAIVVHVDQWVIPYVMITIYQSDLVPVNVVVCYWIGEYSNLVNLILLWIIVPWWKVVASCWFDRWLVPPLFDWMMVDLL